MSTLLIKNITVVNAKESFISDVLIENGKFTKIATNISESSSEVFDGQGLTIIPGVIDTQVHFREPGPTHKEDLESGSKAAILGGVTSFFEMPNTKPSTTNMERIKEKIDIASKTSYANFAFYIGANGKNLSDLVESQGKQGVCGIKIFLGSSTGDLLLYDEEKLLEIFSNNKCMIAVHSENEKMLNERINIRDEATHASMHPVWRDEQTALSSTKMIIEVAKKAKRKVHVLHLTTKDEMKFLSENKQHCTVEVTPQHLTLFAPDCYERLGTYAQMNPPIRELTHQEGLWEGLKGGTVDVIGSDHAPHTKEEKDQGYPNSPSGMPGVQTLLPVMLSHVQEGKLSLNKLIELVCESPSRMWGIEKKGHIQEGYDADFVILDMNKSYKVKTEQMASKCGWTPFEGLEYKGYIQRVYLGGELCVKDYQLVSKGPSKALTFRSLN